MVPNTRNPTALSPALGAECVDLLSSIQAKPLSSKRAILNKRRNMNKAILFVKSYRSGNSIGVKKGYEWYVPIWKALGQHKYEARYHDQLEQLLVKFKYRRLL